MSTKADDNIIEFNSTYRRLQSNGKIYAGAIGSDVLFIFLVFFEARGTDLLPVRNRKLTRSVARADRCYYVSPFFLFGARCLRSALNDHIVNQPHVGDFVRARNIDKSDASADSYRAECTDIHLREGA
jgi:DUF1365 family protein